MTTTRRKVSKVEAKAALPTLGQAQVTLEATTRELRSAQKAYREAADRMQAAEEAYHNGLSTLNATLFAVKSNCKTIPLHSQ